MKKLIFCLIAAASLLSSCSKEEQSSEPALSDNLSSTAITMLPVSASLETKAAIDSTTFPTDRTILLSAYYKPVSGTSVNYFSGVTFAKHATESYWCAYSTKYWPFSGTLDFLAVSYDGLTPAGTTYDANVSEGITLKIPDNSTVQCDILHGSAQDKAKSDNSVDLAFRHAEALLCFVAKSDKAYDATDNLGITIEEIAVEDAYFGGTVAIKAQAAAGDYCTWTDLTDQKEGVAGDIGGVNLLNGTDRTLNYQVPADYMDVEAAGNHMGIGGVGIVVPEQAQTKVCIKYTMHNGRDGSSNAIDNKGLLCSFDLSGNDSYWAEGQKYIYKIYFKSKEITIIPSVVDWVPTPIVKEI